MKITGEQKSKAGAGAIGVGGGTLLVLMADRLPQDNALRIWLLASAPVATVGLKLLLVWGQSAVLKLILDYKVRTQMARIRESFKVALENPDVSEALKQQIRGKLDFVEMLMVNREVKRIEELAELTPEDILNSPALKGILSDQKNKDAAGPA